MTPVTKGMGSTAAIASSVATGFKTDSDKRKEGVSSSSNTSRKKGGGSASPAIKGMGIAATRA